MTRPASYIRISGSNDQLGNLSLPTQARIIGEYAARAGLPAPTPFEESRSAYTDDLEKRPVFARLVAAIERGEFDLLICYDQDRLARDASLALLVANRLTRCGCRIVLINQPATDVQTPDGKLSFTIGAGISEYYSAQISRKSRAGLAHIAANGGYVGGLTFGARRDDDYRRQVDPARAADLRLLLTLAADLGYGAVAAELNRRGVRPPKRAPVWRDTTVRSTIRASRWLLDQPEPWPQLWAAAATRPRLPRANATKRQLLLAGLWRCACGGVIVYSGYYLRKDGSRVYGIQCRWWSKERPTGYRCAGGRKTAAARYERAVIAEVLALPDLTDVDLAPPDMRAARAALDARRLNLARAVARGLPRAEEVAIAAAIDADEAALPLDSGTERALALALRATQALFRGGVPTPAEGNALLRGLIAGIVVEGTTIAIAWVPALVRLLDARGFPHGHGVNV